MKISKFQYLTQDISKFTHQELIENACKNGIRWIQLRVKNKSTVEYLQIAKDARKITQKFKTVLIINDQVEIAKEVDADGVHLGKNDMLPEIARKILGHRKIIGATANTFEDILKLQKQDINYIGLGPFQFTTTKQNLSQILGLQGYQNIIKKCKENKINIPIIAIGGIEAKDVKSLLDTGIYGIAVSAAIHHNQNIAENIKAFEKIILL
jgi:thiamine-phosphate diphosphorylase